MKIRENYLIASFALTLLLLIAFPIISFADEMSGDCGDHLKWNFNENSGVLTISGTGDMYDYNFFYEDNIPPWYKYRETITIIKLENGITSIGQDAFWGCHSVTEVTMPDSVKTIGMSAFGSCSALTEIIIPDNVTSIGEFAFAACANIKSITLSKSLEDIPYGAFSMCINLMEIAVPDGIQSIGESAFEYCYKLIEITIPDGVQSIGTCAFESCKDLVEINIPASVKSIGDKAFSNCEDLAEICFMGNGLPTIGESAFEYICTEGNVYLKGSRIASSNAGDSGNISILMNASMPETWFSDKANTVTEVSLPSEHDIVSASADSYRTDASNAGDTILFGSYEQDNNFNDGSESIEWIVLDNSDGNLLLISKYGLDASYFNSYNRKGNTWEESDIREWLNTDFYSLAFSQEEQKLIKLTTVPGDPGFTAEETNDTKDYVFLLGYQEISAFSESDNDILRCEPTEYASNQMGEEPQNAWWLRSAGDMNTVETVSWSSFQNNYYIAEGGYLPDHKLLVRPAIVLSNEEMNVDAGVCGNDLVWIYRNHTLTISGTGKMYNYDNDTTPWKAYTDDITSITIENGVTSIGAYAFSGCMNASIINIPSTVTDMGEGAFCACTQITSITIPQGITRLEKNLFYCCSGLENVVIPNSVKSIGIDTFTGCNSLKSITIPDSVTEIGSAAFYSCAGLTNITIPNSVTSIGDEAFNTCTNLTSVSVPNSVTSIGRHAFGGCWSLTSITLPDSISRIEDSEFSGCQSLKSITVPESITQIGDCAFSSCYELSDIRFNGTALPSLGENVFAGVSDKGQVYLNGERLQITDFSDIKNVKVMLDTGIPRNWFTGEE